MVDAAGMTTPSPGTVCTCADILCPEPAERRKRNRRPVRLVRVPDRSRESAKSAAA